MSIHTFNALWFCVTLPVALRQTIRYCSRYVGFVIAPGAVADE